MLSAQSAMDQMPTPMTGTSVTVIAAATVMSTSMHRVAIISVEGRATAEVTASRPMKASATASSRTLMAALPRRLLTASAGLPATDEVIVLAISGRDVMPPRSSIPTKACPQPVLTVMASSACVSRVPAIQTITAAARKIPTLIQSG